MTQLPPWRMFFAFLRTHYRVVEVNEPLMTVQWATRLAVVLAVRLRSAVTRRPSLIVAYCIENGDPVPRFLAGSRLPLPVRALLFLPLRRVLAGALDRMAFRTMGAYDRYAATFGAGALAGRSRVFEAVPAPCDCPAPQPSAARSEHVLFLGGFKTRKGVAKLMAAWPAVAPAHPSARLTIIGKGLLQDEVLGWARDRAEVDVVLDPPRARIHQQLRASGVLVLPSQPIPIWREQVGLPIVEALAHGCQVVTTAQTGLAAWLRAHGHLVVDDPADTVALADAISAALATRRTPADVLADLPALDVRIQADNWLITGPNASTAR